jgi:hypothetical protein
MSDSNMSTDPITLSPEHSQRLRALAHAVGCLSVEELLIDMVFSQSPKNIIENLFPGQQDVFEFTDEENRRIEEAWILAGDYSDVLGWDEFAEVAEKMPAFDPANYPAKAPANVVEIAPHLHLVK